MLSRKNKHIFSLFGALSVALVTLGSPGPLLAQSAPSAGYARPNRPGFAFGSPLGEALLFFGSALSNASAKIPFVQTGWGPDAPHPYDATANRISDVTGAYAGSAIATFAGYGFEIGYYEQASVQAPGVMAMRTSLVDIEALLLTTGVVNAVKHLTGRCRPYQFVAGKCTTDVVDSFPSGHVAPMGGLAGARLLLSLQSSGPVGYRWGSFALSETMAVTTAFLRVAAGKHSISDVVAGFLLGHAIGMLLSLAHPMEPVPSRDMRGEKVQEAGDALMLSWSGQL